MTKEEQQLRQDYIDLFEQYKGCQTGDKKELFLVNVYNLYEPLPRGIKMNPTLPWCACSVSAIAFMMQLTDIIPFEMGCWEQMQLAKEKGIWKNTSYTPLPGDLIMYDWKKKKDGVPDHIGVVRKVENGIIYTIEGNVNGGKAEEMQHAINDPEILGFIAPNYSSKVGKEEYRVTTALYLRSKPSALSKFICVMPKDAIVEFLGEKDGRWMKVLYKGNEGWCSGNYLEAVK